MADYVLTQTGAEVQDLLDAIGTDTLATEAQTLSGAVNELDSNVDNISNRVNTMWDTRPHLEYYSSRTVSVANNAEILRITSGYINTKTVALECTFADPSSISGDVTWTSYNGYIVFTGTCTSATTANVTLACCENTY